MLPELVNLKPSELAQLYILAVRFPWLVTVNAGDIRKALVILIGEQDTQIAINDARKEHY